MEKSIFPIKTKIAASWLIIISGGFICFGLSPLIEDLYLSHTIDLTPETGALFGIIFFFLPGLILLLPSILLLKKKKMGYYWALIALSIGFLLIIFQWIRIFILAIEYPYCLLKTKPVCERISFATQSLAEYFWMNTFLTLIIIIPFFLLLFDRKNFWKVAS